MASELFIRYTCDRCARVAVEGDAEFHAELPVRVGELDRVVDLCTECYAETVAAVVEAFTELGRPAGPKPPTPQPQQPPRQARDNSRRASPGTTNLDVRCKLCPHVCTTPTAVWQHAQLKHNMNRGEYRAAAVRPDSALGRGVSGISPRKSAAS